jgi:hypothetical protein
MKKIPYGLMLLLLLCPVTYAGAQVSLSIGLPSVSIGINLPLLPNLVPIPGYPAYYAPGVNANYFFYDGMYWVYQDDSWYASTWYNGPWGVVDSVAVPLFILRIPVRYYQQPPDYFRGWQANAPPRWGQHWGNGWEQQRSGWNRWNRTSVPVRAPLPAYQRQYSGQKYPGVERQQALRNQSYRYQPRDTAVRQHFQEQGGQRVPAAVQRGKQGEPPVRSQGPQQDPRRAPQPQLGAPPDPRSQPPQRGGESALRSAPARIDQPQRGPGPPEQRQQAPRAQQGQEQRQQERGPSPESNRGNDQGRDRDDDRGRGRDR